MAELLHTCCLTNKVAVVRTVSHHVRSRTDVPLRFLKKRLSLWVRRKWSGVGGGSAVVLPYAPWIACK